MKNDLINNKILDISKNYCNYLMSLENVVGIGLGHKNINKINTLEPCIHVLVEKKIDSKFISFNNIIPKAYMGIKTDVIDSGSFSAKLNIDLINKVRPLECGYCIGGGEVTTGTLGCIVTKNIKKNKEYFILSNNHVLAGTNTLPVGTPIIQPSFFFTESMDTEYVIAKLSNFIKLKLKNKLYTPNNYVDCAIAKIENRAFIPIVNKLGLNNGSVRGVAPDIYLGLKVKKIGYTTGLTTGKLTTIGTTLDIKFPKASNPIRFKNQILSDMKNGSGDSGSLVLTESNDAVGLLFAGTNGNTAMNDIKEVLKALKVDLYSGFNIFI